jgi:WD40 repeat protein
VLVFEGEFSANNLCFTADGSRLLVTRHADGIEVWTLASGGHDSLLTSTAGTVHAPIAVHPNGTVIRVLRNHPPFVVSLSDPDGYIASDTGDIRRVAVSPNADWIVVVRVRDNQAWYAGYPCGPDLHFAGEPAWESIAFFPGAAIGGFVGPGQRFVGIRAGRVVVYDTPTGKVHAVCVYPAQHLHTTTAAPDGRRFAAMGYDKLYLWDTATWGKPTRVPGFNRPIRSMAYHPTRPILATVQWGQALVKFLDADTGKPISKFQWKLGEMCSVAFSPDGTLAAAGSASGKIVVWDVDE